MKNAEQKIPVTSDITILIHIYCYVNTPNTPVYGLASREECSINIEKINWKKVENKYNRLKDSHLG